MRLFCFLLLASSLAMGEVHKLSLQQALKRAALQNPDLALARLDAERAQHDIQIAGDAFSPRVRLRSDAVYTNGYPNSIGPDASSPALLGERTDMSLYNRPQHYQVAAAKQDAITAEIGPRAKADDVARQIASLYLDAEQSAREIDVVQAEMSSYRKIEAAVAGRVNEGYALPVDLSRSKVESAQNLQRLHALEADKTYSESLIALALGYSGNDLVEPAESAESFALPSFQSESDAVDTALSNNKEMMRLQSGMLAKRLERRSYAAVRLPQVDLVQQYALFAKRTYQDYFPGTNFQRNNAQLGASFTLPILVGLEPGARLQQADTDEEKLQVQIDDLGHRIRAATHRAFEELSKARSLLDVARQQLSLAQDESAVLNSQYAEGRSSLSDIEKAMNTESERRLAVSESEIGVARAKLNLLQQMGNLMPALMESLQQRNSLPNASD
ncbi:MAG TPA: TolC family protein [Bryobacteraceae bacterium]|nr:TolC family protein [Bryobacteraceae bacterium]